MQCMNPDCHHTEFLTAVYKFLDAEALLVHINAHANQQYIPQVALNVSLQPAVLPLNQPDNKIDCANLGCVTRTGQCTQVNCNCIPTCVVLVARMCKWMQLSLILGSQFQAALLCQGKL
jgi:hypothetical protein